MSAVIGAGVGWQTRGPVWSPAVQGGIRPAPAVTQPFPNIGRFRRHLNGLTTDATNAPLGSVSVKWFDTVTDVLVGSGTSDALGAFDFPIYVDGVYQGMIWKAGTPTVFGASDRVAPV
jgi:hypothetical protein